MKKCGVELAIDLAGNASKLAEVIGITPQAMGKIRRRGKWPRTEYTGETKYAETIADKYFGHVTKDELLALPQRKRARGAQARATA